MYLVSRVLKETEALEELVLEDIYLRSPEAAQNFDKVEIVTLPFLHALHVSLSTPTFTFDMLPGTGIPGLLGNYVRTPVLKTLAVQSTRSGQDLLSIRDLIVASNAQSHLGTLIISGAGGPETSLSICQGIIPLISQLRVLEEMWVLRTGEAALNIDTVLRALEWPAPGCAGRRICPMLEALRFTGVAMDSVLFKSTLR